jgi:hypothetical protein
MTDEEIEALLALLTESFEALSEEELAQIQAELAGESVPELTQEELDQILIETANQ